MSLRETLEAAVADLKGKHEVNRVNYRKALADAANAQKSVRELCDVAFVSANELGAAVKALEELNRNAPAVVAEGELET